MGLNRAGIALIVAAAATAVTAAPAHAANLQRSGNDYLYDATGTETYGLTLTISGSTITFNGNDPLTLLAGSGCTLTNSQDATCPATGIAQIDVDTGSSTATGANALSTIDTITIPIEATGGPGNDVLDGGSGADILAGGGGADTLAGSPGNDVLNGGDGADSLNDSGGIDTITYAGRSTGVTANLATGSNSDGDTYGGNFEGLTGTSFNDSLTAANLATTLNGGSGEDTLNGGTQADTLIGGSDTDTLNGNDGDDTLNGSGGASADAHNGGNGTDTADYSTFTTAVTANLTTGTGQDGDTYNAVENITGGAGADTLTGNTGANVLIGNNGSDTLVGGTGVDTLRGGDAAGGSDTSEDTVSYDDGRSAATGVVSEVAPAGKHADNDVYSDIQNLTGGDGDDTLAGDANANVLAGGNGRDTLIGGAGADKLNGGSPLGIADASQDVASYADRSTPLTMTLPSTGIPDGDTFNDIQGLEGGSGADTLTGDGNANTLRGGAGGDLLRGMGGADTLEGGTGTDIASYSDKSVAVVAGVTTGADGDTLTTIEGLTGGTAGDTLTGDAGANPLNGGPGDDTLIGGAGADALTGGGGTDAASYQDGRGTGVTVDLASGTSSDGDTFTAIARLIGSEQADTLSGSDAVADVIEGRGGGDTLNGRGAADSLRGGAGNDVINGGDGDDPVLEGGEGDDIIAGGAGADALTGGPGVDIVDYSAFTTAVTASLEAGTGPGDTFSELEGITGGSGNDTLTGNAGANVLNGGGGNDVLRGLAGGDAFAGGDGSDTVTFDERSAAVVVALDGVANDGAPSEGDQISGDVETIVGTGGDDTLTGNSAANALLGGPGNDVLTGGSGPDDLQGAGGDDTLKAIDGEADSVSCGDGNDKAETDPQDAATGCETTTVVAPPVVVPPVVVPVVVDNDGDGLSPPLDCNDANASIRPGALEIVGNGVDENCDGKVEPFPLIGAGFSFGFSADKTSSKLTQLRATSLPAGSRLETTCTASKALTRKLSGKASTKGCPFAKRTKTFTKATAREDLTKLFAKRRLPVGAVVKLKVSSPTALGKVFTLTVRRNAGPSKKTTCFQPSGAATACQ